MLILRDMSFSLAGKPLFENASARIPAGARVGLVGRNGTGKSTLFRLIEGALTPDSGEVELRRGARIGGVAQEAPGGPESLIDVVLAADAERAALLAEAETASDPMRIAEIQTRLTDIDAHSAEARAATILAGLGFPEADQHRPCAEFSGGWRMRVALAGALFAAPDLLLLDEPTNYLDLEGVTWLESYLARYPATFVIISHDRGLLNRAVDSILSLERRKLNFVNAPFDEFDRMRREKAAHLVAAANRQKAERAHIQSFVDRFRYKASKARQAQSRLKMLERMQPIETHELGPVAPFRFPQPDELAPPLLALDGVSVGYDGKTILSKLSLRIDPDDRIALLGANGQGKSTLARLIAGRLAPMTGSRAASPRMKVGFFAQHQLDDLVAGETPVQHMARLKPLEKPAQRRARLAAGGIGAEIADTPVEKLSGGQKARLLMGLMALDAPNLLILDEPTNHLDMESREALALALNDYPGAVILISHDPFLVDAVADRLWLVKDGAAKPFDEDMDAYRRLLLADRAGKPAPARPAPARRTNAEKRREIAPLKADLAACEARVEKLEAMRLRIDALLADPDLYTDADSSRFEDLSRKRDEIMQGLARAETLWEQAAARLEAAENAGRG